MMKKTVVENALKQVTMMSLICYFNHHGYQVNLLDAANKKSRQLSGGMRRRLSVAMACVGSPDILILGEYINCFYWLD